MTFVQVWIGYAICGAFVFSAVFVWAVRTRQFSELDRQRRLALAAAEPIEERAQGGPARVDRYTCHALAIISLALMAAAVFLGMR